MSKHEKPRKRFAITHEQERMLANVMYGLIPSLKETPTGEAIKLMYEKNNPETEVGEHVGYEIDLEKWIDLIGIQWIKSTTLPYVAEVLLKYHLIQQTAGESIDTGYYELEQGEDGHDLHLLYLKTTPDFKEKLQVSYNQFISETKKPIETDIENILPPEI